VLLGFTTLLVAFFGLGWTAVLPGSYLGTGVASLLFSGLVARQERVRKQQDWVEISSTPGDQGYVAEWYYSTLARLRDVPTPASGSS
jgi:hypothetical protein